jgi:catechol 2,3-dioxygenase-like lactoylglutathione lyase family enzyme
MIRPTASFTVFIVDDLAAAKAYYTDHLSFSVVFDADWYVHLATDTGVQVGFMRSGLPEMPAIFEKAFPGEGAIFSLETADADTAFAYAEKSGLDIIAPIRSEEWGQRHFLLVDPNGIIVDIIQNIQPTTEFEGHYEA